MLTLPNLTMWSLHLCLPVISRLNGSKLSAVGESVTIINSPPSFTELTTTLSLGAKTLHIGSKQRSRGGVGSSNRTPLQEKTLRTEWT